MCVCCSSAKRYTFEAAITDRIDDDGEDRSTYVRPLFKSNQSKFQILTCHMLQSTLLSNFNKYARLTCTSVEEVASK